jgi:hypothetical protein
MSYPGMMVVSLLPLFDYMYGATAKGVKTRPSFQDMILPEVLPGNDCLTTWMVRQQRE